MKPDKYVTALKHKITELEQKDADKEARIAVRLPFCLVLSVFPSPLLHPVTRSAFAAFIQVAQVLESLVIVLARGKGLKLQYVGADEKLGLQEVEEIAGERANGGRRANYQARRGGRERRGGR